VAERLEEGTDRFGPFRLAPDGRLLRGGRTVPLAPKPLAVLQLLVGSPGRVVSKREILEQVWAGEDVGEASLTSCIHGLRDALGDRRRRGRYLETVHGRGYRFTSNVERVGTSGPAPVRWRVAIAPFDDESRSPAYLSEGFLDDVISRLGRWHASGIDAIARSSTARLLAAHGDLLRLARALRLDFLVTGRLRADARELRGAAELIRSRDGVVVWSRDFTSPADGRALLAGEIAEAVAKELIELRGGEPVAEPAPAPALDPRSHRALLRGQFLNQFRTDSGLRRSIRCFEQALEWDPRFTAAHIALA
jgi:transcriptional regulator HilA, main transcriptional regulator of SPI1